MDIKIITVSLCLLMVTVYVNATRFSDEQFAFIEAVNRRDLQVVRNLLERGGINVNYGFSRSSLNRVNTPLVRAVKNNDVEMTRLLLEHGANAWVSDKHGDLLLFWAQQNNVDPEIIHMLEARQDERETVSLGQQIGRFCWSIFSCFETVIDADEQEEEQGALLLPELN